MDKVSRKSKVVGALVLFLVFIVLFLDTFNIGQITGLIISNSDVLEYEKNINNSYNSYSEIIISSEETSSNMGENYSIKKVKSVRITGSIIGNGSIYVSDSDKTYLVVDESISQTSNSKNKGLSSITGLAIDDLSNDDNSSNETTLFYEDENIVSDEISSNMKQEAMQDVSVEQEIINQEPLTENLNQNTDLETIVELEEIIEQNASLNDSENVYEYTGSDSSENESNVSKETIISPESTELSNEILFETECIDSCDINLDKDIIIIISPNSGGNSSIYIKSIFVEYDVEKNKELPKELQKNQIREYSDDVSKNILSQKIQKINIDKVIRKEYYLENINNYEFNSTKENSTATKFDVYAKDKNNQKNNILLRELYSITDLENIEFIEKKKHNQKDIVTDIIYVNSINITNATINISSDVSIDAIVMCQDYNSKDNSCSNWEITSIPFTYENGIITFTVEHFTGYGGVVVNNDRLYARSTTNSLDTTAFPTLNSTNDGTVNMANFTLASGTPYNFMNASTGPLTGRMIRSTDMINFSSYWKNLAGTRVDFAYATFKLYKNVSGTFTLICQFGNDSTGGVQIPDGADGLRYGNCTPSSNILVENGSSLVYVINVWAQTIGGGGAATKVATLQWDTATANTSFNYTYIIPPEINVTTNQTTYYASQNVNITGTFYWLNLSGINPGNVTVQIYNNTNSMVYTTNVTTSSTGSYTTNYTLPSIVESAGWTVNVTGIYNESINATNGTTFSTSISTVPCQDIISSGTTTLNSNLQINASNCFNVYVPNVLIDCAGYNITGNNTLNTYGIYSNSTNTSIINCSVDRFNYGIFFDAGAHNGSINYTNIFVNSSNGVGLYVLSSDNFNILNVNTTTGSISLITGTIIESSSNIKINSSIFSTSSASGTGIYLLSSNNYSVYNSNVTGSENNGLRLSSSNNGYFYNNYFRAIGDFGYAFTSNGYSYNLSFMNNIFSEVASDSTALSLIGENIYFNNNNISGASSSYTSEFLNSKNVSILSNNFTVNITSGTYSLPFKLGNITNSLVTNNSLNIYGSVAINVFRVQESNNVSIFGNLINASLSTMRSLLVFNSTNITIYHNNFTGSGKWVNVTNSSNIEFNTTIGGIAQGNYYHNISSHYVADSDSNGFADVGSQYPFNSTTLGSDMWTGNSSDFAPATSYQLITISSRISPINSTANNTILGYCNGTDSNNNNVSYIYRWYLNNVVNSTTYSSQNWTSALEVNVANLSTNNILPGQTWHLGCSVATTGINSTEKNSTTTLLQNLTCINLTTQGTFTLTNDISYSDFTCFNIYSPNIILDCAGYNITGNNASNRAAIYTNSSNSTIINCEISLFDIGIHMNTSQSRNSLVQNNTIYTTLDSGIGILLINGASYNNIKRNYINTSTANTAGIRLSTNTEYNNISENIVTTNGNNANAIYLSVSNYNNISNNNLSTYLYTSYGITLDGSSDYNFIVNNIINTTLDNSYGINLYSNSNLATIFNNNISTKGASGYGIMLSTSKRNNVSNNFIFTNDTTSYGIRLTSADMSNITNNLVITDGSSSHGIYASSSENITIISNNVTTHSSAQGIFLGNGKIYNATVINNFIVTNYFSNSGIGIYLRNRVVGSNISNNNIRINGREYGIYIINSSDNIIVANVINVTNSTYAHIFLNLTASNITIYHNNFTGIGKWIDNSNSTNLFNTSVGGVAQGNYYSNVTHYNIYDSNSNGFGDSGSQYPFNSTTVSSNWVGEGSDFGPATTRIITTISARISPVNSTSNESLFGYCNGTESLNTNVSYVYSWYNNSVLFSTGITSENWTSGLEVNAANLSSINLVAGHNWTFGCIATTNGANATEINSSLTNIQSFGTLCQNITSSGTVTLNQNVQVNDSSCFNVFASNVVFDCAGYSITGNNATGMSAIFSNSTNTTVQNCIIDRFLYGIFFNYTSNGTIKNNTITFTNNTAIGIYLRSAANNTMIFNNNITTNGSSSYALFSEIISTNSNISNNNFTTSGSSSYALYIDRLSNTIVFNNRISTFGSTGYGLYARNNIDNLSIKYNLITTNSSSAGQAIRLATSVESSLIDSNNIHTYGTTSGYGIGMDSFPKHNFISNNNISTVGSSSAVIRIVNLAHNNTIQKNTITSTGASSPAIELGSTSENNSFYNNTLNVSSASTFHIYTGTSSSKNTFYYNNFTGNGNWVNNSLENYFNTSVGSVARGNYYSNVSQYDVYDTNADGWGDSGSQYPFNSTTVSSKWLGNGSDFGPATTRTVSNTPPIISNIVSQGAIDPIEESDRILQFNFTVIDIDGNNTINISSSRTYVNNSEFTRSTSQCSGFAINATSVNISCNLTLKYYDPSGIWSINVSVEDNSDSYTQNLTTTFTYNVLTAVAINSNAFDFGSVSSGSENLTTTPLIIRNTGNSNFSFARIKAYDLTNSTSSIGAGNFSINFSNISTGQILSNDTFINITNTSLSVSNDTYNSSLTLYVYADIPLGIPALKYNSIIDWVANLIS